MAGKTIAAKSAAITAATSGGYVSIASTTGWYKNAKGSMTKAAFSLLTAIGQPADAATVTIGAKVYTFQTVLTNVDGHVLIGLTANATLVNLAAAINLGAGAGVGYAAATTANAAGVIASMGAGDTMNLVAKAPGTAGNSIATLDDSGNLAWTGLVLAGGAAGVTIVITEIVSATQMGVRIVPDSVVGAQTYGPDYGRSDCSAFNTANGVIYQNEQFIFNIDDLPLS